MAYNVRIYENTGFNAVNIPYKKSTVQQVAVKFIDVNGLEILQPRHLSTIRVPVQWSDVNNADYCVIWSDTSTYNDGWCYFVTNVTMLNADTAELTIVPDYLTSAGGISDVEILDGITTRSTYALNHVEPNKLDSGDEYLAPSQTMQLFTEWQGEGDEYKDVIESTINIVATAQKDDAITAVSSSSYDVTYPVPEYAENGRFTRYRLSDGSKIFKSAGSMLFAYGVATVDSLITKGLAKIRGMGLESAILNAVRIPTKYAEVDSVYDATADGVRQNYVLTMLGKWSETATGIAMNVLGTGGAPENGVLNYSEYTKFGLMSASGESIEADPKDLMTTSNPIIKCVGDPRPNGKPYFRFKYINNTKTDNIEFFRNCISGLNWKSTPLVYTEASGNALNTARYQSSRHIADIGYQQAQRSIGLQKEVAQQNYDFSKDTQTLGLLSSGIDGALSTLGAGAGGGMFTNVQGATSTALQYLGRDLAYAQTVSGIAYNQLATVENYAASKVADALSYGIAQNVNVPTVQFPYNTETLRDFYGNGVLVYRYWYTNEDIARIGRILRAYGVKYTMKLDKAHFIPEDGKEFAYCEANGVSIANAPQWLANGIALQLSNGVRIWKNRPHTIS